MSIRKADPMNLVEQIFKGVGKGLTKAGHWIMDDFQEGMRIAEIENPIKKDIDLSDQNRFKVPRVGGGGGR